MAICATSHALSDGTVVIALDAQNLNLTTCQMVVITGAEFDSQLLNFTPTDAMQISTSIVFLWAVAWSFKAVAKAINTIGASNESDSN